MNKMQGKHKDGTIVEWKWQHWYRDHENGGWICQICHNRRVAIKYSTDQTARRIKFKGKGVYVDTPPRIGICNFCRAVVDEINTQTGKLCNGTDMAHIQYHQDDPLKDTIELCDRCHRILDIGIPEDRECYRCGSKSTYIDKKGTRRWYRPKSDSNQFMCEQCYRKYKKEKREIAIEQSSKRFFTKNGV